MLLLSGLHIGPWKAGVEGVYLRVCAVSISGRPAQVPERWAPLHCCLTSPASACRPAPHILRLQPQARPALRNHWPLAGGKAFMTLHICHCLPAEGVMQGQGVALFTICCF